MSELAGMSTGPSPACEGRADADGPVPPGRAHVIGRLEAEARQARGCFEWRRADELEEQIRVLSAGSPVPPAAEKASTARHRTRNRTPAGR